MRKMVVWIFLSVLAVPSFAQESGYDKSVDPGYNNHSVYPVHGSRIMYKKTVWRRMDLNEKQNLPFFSEDNEITKILIQAVEDGRLPIYENDSLKKRMSKEKFFENLKLPDLGGGEDDGFGGGGDGWGDFGGGWGGESGGTETVEEEAGSDYYLPNQITLLKIKEDIYFDKQRSRMYYDIQSISMWLPASVNATGIEKMIGIFRYKDVERVFREMPDKAIWYNRYNNSEHRNMADAFLLRLFNARIIKVSNPLDQYIEDIYIDPKRSLYASQEAEHQLMEYEHSLWEY